MEARRLDDGSYVIDLGSKWFRQRPNGQVVARETVVLRGSSIGSVRTRPATSDEIEMVRQAIKRIEP